MSYGGATKTVYRFLGSWTKTTALHLTAPLFGRPMKTKLPELTTPCSDPEIRERDQTAKAKMKEYADNKRYVKPSNAKEGDTVLVKRDDSKKKSDTQYDPRPLIIVEKMMMVRKL